MYSYGLTLRKCEQPNFIRYYEDFINKLTSKHSGIHIEYHFEDSAGLHMHAYIVSRRKIYVNKIHPGKGYNLDLTLLKSDLDQKHWVDYIRKDMESEIDLINKSHQEENAFRDYQEAYKNKAFQEDFCEACNFYECNCNPTYRTVDITKNVFAQYAQV